MLALSSSVTCISPLLCNNNINNNKVISNEFPSFLPKEIHDIKDPFARNMARRIQRLPVQVTFSDNCIMSSCIRPLIQGKTKPVVLLHCFDSSCLEWSCAYPMLEKAGVESWAIDILGWGFSDLRELPLCDVESKRDHLYQFWKSYIKRPMILVGPSLGAAIAIDFAAHHPDTVSKLVVVDASVYAEGLGDLAKLPKMVTYAGLALLKSIPLRLYLNKLALNGIPYTTSFNWMKVGRLHCLMPWWRDANLSFISSGGYNVTALIKQIRQQVLIVWGEDDRIISYKFAVRLHSELQDAILRSVPDCGHIPHVEKPNIVANLIIKFAYDDSL